MKNQIKIVIPEYIESLRLSSSRRKKFFSETSAIPDKYLKEDKSIQDRYIFKNKGGTSYLYDTVNKEFVVKNPIAAGTPRDKIIAGNAFYVMTNEHVRIKIVGAIKDCFRPYLPSSLGLQFPVIIGIELYCAPRHANWDLDNMWIYNKVFQDLLIEKGLIPDDSIQYITRPGACRYIPIVDHSKRKMVFTLSEDDNPVVISHLLYNREPKTPVPGPWNHGFVLMTTTNGKAGDIAIDIPGRKFFINIGVKKVVMGAVIKPLGRVFSHCIQLNTAVSIGRDFYTEYEKFIKRELSDKGIPVIVYDK